MATQPRVISRLHRAGSSCLVQSNWHAHDAVQSNSQCPPTQAAAARAPRTSRVWPASPPRRCRASSTRRSRSTPRPERLVRDAVAKLRYVPHGAARALRSPAARWSARSCPRSTTRSTRAPPARCRRVLDAKGYSMVLAEHHYDLGAEVRITEQLIRHGVDAFVFVGLDHDPALFALLESYGRPLRPDLGRRSDAAPSEHRLRQPRRDLRDDAPPARPRPPPLRPAQRPDRGQRPRDRARRRHARGAGPGRPGTRRALRAATARSTSAPRRR